MGKRAVVLLLAVALAGCGGSSKTASTTTSVLPPHTSLQLAALRLTAGMTPRIDLVEMDAGGGHQRVVATAPRAAEPAVLRLSAPAWSPSGDALYVIGVTHDRPGTSFVYPVSDAYRVGANRSLHAVTDTGDVLAAVPSPDGKSLLLERMEHPGAQPLTISLWLANADGSNMHRLFAAEDGRTEILGGWSPDGSRITFARCATPVVNRGARVPNTCSVYVSSWKGGEARKLAGRALDPAFSPDGRRIAFVSDRDEHGLTRVGADEDAFAKELYVMASDGGRQTRLTTTKQSETRPTWSPDGRRIAYQVQVRTGFRKELRQTTPEGTCTRTIATDAADWYQEPAWRPGRISGRVPRLCG